MDWKKVRWPEWITAVAATLAYVAPRPKGVQVNLSPDVSYRIAVVVIALALIVVIRVVRDYRTLRRRVLEIHQWLYSPGHTAFSDTLARRQAGKPQGVSSLRDLIGMMAEWEHKDRPSG